MTALPRPHDDVLIAASALIGGLLLWWLGLDSHPDQGSGPRRLTLVPLFVICAVDLLRRRMPKTALAIGCVAMLGDQFTVGNVATVALFTDLAYAAVLYGSPTAARRLPALATVLTVLATVAAVMIFRDAQAVLVGIFLAVLVVVPTWTGLIVRTHRDAAEAAELRAEQTTLVAEIDRTQAVTARHCPRRSTSGRTASSRSR